MALQVRINGINELFNATKFYCRRTHGQAIEFGVTLSLDFAQDNRLGSLAEKIWQGSAAMEILWDGNSVSPTLVIGQSQTLEDAVSAVLLKAYYKIPQYQPGCFVPRKRILKADNLFQLLKDNFDDLVQWENSVANALNDFRFPDAKKTNHIQDGLTDDEMLERLIAAYNQAESPENALTLSGTTKEKWQLTWLQEKKYAELNLQNERKIDGLIKDGISPLIKMNHTLGSPVLFKQGKSAASITFAFNWGNFESPRWHDWYEKQLPAFYQNKFVHEITDYFRETGHEFLEWESFITVLPQQTLIESSSKSLNPWMRIGKISQRTTKSQWLEAELDGFENGFNKVDVRLTTPYSGKAGDDGFHLVPEQDTEIVLMKGNDWKEPVWFVSNVRSKEVIKDAPFWKMDVPGLWNFNALKIEAESVEMAHRKDLKISAMNIHISSEQKTEMNALELKATAKTQVVISSSAALKITGKLVDFEGQATLNAKAPLIKLN